ncbi:bisanhydrobacterioruberin hydratase [Natrinema halophilum]|uniref:Carotenoid biosynthesis protein n=1 Tax=Natrinema halophilum TaxID=1699371 RepID=A0A7D5KZ52_9EURY|nr:bisanhydrobacterioruberin hydratase [Natrinema halophilum]QLG48540.1 carotenoid biosynthesis protein [Natrinema halophilum]
MDNGERNGSSTSSSNPKPGANPDPKANVGSNPKTTDPTIRSHAPSSDAEETTRDVFQHRLEELVCENRFTIAVVFPVVGAVSLLASAEGLLPPSLSYNPLLLLFGTLVMRSPLVVALLPQVDRRAIVPLSVLTGYTYAIELIGVRTNWPYGAFEYGVRLGPMLGDEVPLALPLFFVPLVVNAYLLSLLVLGNRADRHLPRLLGAITAVLAIDLVLDPGAVAIGFWTYTPPGGYYGVPVSNYWGWLLSSVVAVVLVDIAFDRGALLDRVQSCEYALDDLVSFVLLWGTINVVYGNWLAAGVAGLFCLGLGQTDRYDIEMITTAFSTGRSQG